MVNIFEHLNEVKEDLERVNHENTSKQHEIDNLRTQLYKASREP